MTSTLSAEVAYVGNKGTHVFAGNNPDVNANEPSTVGYLFNAPNCTAPGQTNCNVPRDQRRPLFNAYPSLYPTGFANDVTYFGNLSSSNYNALQTRLEKRFTGGLQFQASYTYAKAMNFDQDYYVNQPHYGLVDFNRKHAFILSSVYELPFGRGRKYLNNMNRVADFLVGGFQLSPTVTWQSGLPFSVSYSQCNQDIDVGPCWAAKTGSVKTDASSLQTPANGPYVQYFQATSTPLQHGQSFNGYSRPAADTFGSRNSLYGPRYFNTDLAAAKNFAITERVKAQFRMEIFNLFNHPQLGNPNGCIDGGGSCGRITSLLGNVAAMRNIQFALRFDF